ncbi:hypothetical protein SAMN04487948_11025 [Halogranum amylolyticum]|uniref:Polyprenyl synthetase n=1 Tax=Halogranum amylolyticum TaxID=660520 RepID=A0A1H8U924_9EURY|nr:hypothetical protein [Halogranum amylolyticum]SEO99681.1 hypothetical protein SAMN04487948_11025 [Halogranum amylolyticum]
MDESVIFRRKSINARLDTVLSAADEDGLPIARRTVEEPDDRWYGQLVIGAYNSSGSTTDPEMVLPAAVATELLRGYCRLRSRLLIQLTDDRPHSFTLEPTSALLAGEYLSTSAYSSLRSIDHPALSDCFEVLSSVAETITEAFTLIKMQPTPPTSDQCAFFDMTAGSIGAAATVLGAILADVDGTRRDDLATVGCGFSTERQIRHALDPESKWAKVAPPAFDEQELRTHAKRRRDEARQALEELATTANVGYLRTFTDVERR